MAELQLVQTERRSYLVPALIVLVLTGLAGAAIYFFTPRRIADVRVTRATAVPIHTVYKGAGLAGGDIKVLGDQAQDDLYVLLTVEVRDELKLPIFIKDLTGTLTAADGGTLTTSAVQRRDFETLRATYPQVKENAGAPLLRETAIQPGETASGTVILHFPVPRALWDARTGATVTVDTYHQGPLSAAVPR
ncbi:MAG: hypothetical protein M3O02_07280 [Acidobacteriota bacterium]|nr:hypothetical protein [Acidobacteriota bacterium]